MSNVYTDFEADKAAVTAVNFCSLWPTAKPILQQLATVVKKPLVKVAIRTVIAAGDAYCGSTVSITSTGTERLIKAGLQGLDHLSDDQIRALESMSDSELRALGKYQSAVDGNNIHGSGIGSGFF